MKKIKIVQLTLLSTVMLFTACSNKQEALKKVSNSQQISVYNIMGITAPKKEIVHLATVDKSPVRYHAVSNWVSTPVLNAPKYNTITYDESKYNTITYDESKYNTISYDESSYNTITYDEPSYQEEEDVSINNNNIIQNNNTSPDIEFISYRAPSAIEYVHHRSSSRFNDIVNGIETNAKSFLGTPYVWGATGPNTFDCSGFTQWVYRDVGIPIPRVSRDQAKVGEYVTYNHLKRGDMVFFDTHKRKTGKVTHVGIYLGKGNFIHASSAGKKVVIFNFNKKPFYKKRFLWGRRVTNSNMHYASN